MVRLRDILILDNNAIRKLAHGPSKARLTANLKATGREFWPTGVNVLEALKSRDHQKRIRLLRILADLAGDAHALPLPTEALKLIAQGHAAGENTITWAEPRFTRLIRNPEEVTEDLASSVRKYFLDRERQFDATHEKAKSDALPLLNAGGGRARWPDVGSFLDEVWSPPEHLTAYVTGLWEDWSLPGAAPVSALLKDRSWRLYLEGWGAAMYARALAHPQPRRVEHSDLMQLVYGGSAKSTVFVTDDVGLLELGNAILRGRYEMMEVVPLKSVTS
jgi:hypothetical protein